MKHLHCIQFEMLSDGGNGCGLSTCLVNRTCADARAVGDDDTVFQIGEQHFRGIRSQKRRKQLFQLGHQNVDDRNANKLPIHTDGMRRSDGVVSVANIVHIRAMNVGGIVLVGLVKPFKSTEIQALLRALVEFIQGLFDVIIVFEPPFEHPVIVVFAFDMDVAGKTCARAIRIAF